MVDRELAVRLNGRLHAALQTYFAPQHSELAFGYAGEHSAWSLGGGTT
jgi:hypothetical protein